MRIVAPDYLPNEMDVLRARTKTTGIYETRFQMGQLSIQSVGSRIVIWVLLFWQLTGPLACSMLAGKGVKERNGFIVSRT